MKVFAFLEKLNKAILTIIFLLFVPSHLIHRSAPAAITIVIPATVSAAGGRRTAVMVVSVSASAWRRSAVIVMAGWTAGRAAHRRTPPVPFVIRVIAVSRKKNNQKRCEKYVAYAKMAL